MDNNYVFVDPHVLATPTIADIDGDGLSNELILPVSYYYDRNHYGVSENLEVTGLTTEELVDYAAGGIVIVDLSTRKIKKQHLLELTRVSSDQPAYLLAPPTVVKLSPQDVMSVIVGSASGQLHLLKGLELRESQGFPTLMDSITSQVAVEDLTGDGVLELVVGDTSGNVACIDHTGKRLWEHEAKTAIESSVRFANLHSDKSMEVIFTTKFGDLWVLNGTTGNPVPKYPMSLNTLVQSSVLLMHLSNPSSTHGGYHLSAIVPAVTGLQIVDLDNGCIDHVNSTSAMIIPHTLQSDHIDPFNPGLEILVTSLSGKLVLYSTGTVHPTDYEMSVETWPSDTLEGNGFTHKESSFVLVCGRSLTTRDASGTNFHLGFEIHDKSVSASKPKEYHIYLTIGRLYTLLNETRIVSDRRTAITIDTPTPPIPTQKTMILTVCNSHGQCDSASFNTRFNLSFRDVLQWCLALPFLGLVASYLWLLRNESTDTLPTVFKLQKKL